MGRGLGFRRVDPSFVLWEGGGTMKQALTAAAAVILTVPLN